MTLYQIRVLSLGYEEVTKRRRAYLAKQQPEDVQEKRRLILEHYERMGYDAR